MLLFQEFYFEIIVKLGRLNAGPNHLSRIESGEEPTNIEDELPDVQLFRVDMENDHYAPILQFLVTGVALEEISTSQKKQLVVKYSDYQLISEHLYKLGANEILRQCVLPHKHGEILAEAHARVTRGHYGGLATKRKVFQAGL